uniref:Ig-like domain-containing protein n=1 Tax=Aquila chrysaetos chrysaetos TaxID=223781 RepID=A0A663F009_AQUCH
TVLLFYDSMTVIGKGVILPCQLNIKIIPERPLVQWVFTGHSKKIDVITYGGKNADKPVYEDETYQGRTNIFWSEFNKGDVSLHLKNVTLSDKGKYTCSVFLRIGMMNCIWYCNQFLLLFVCCSIAKGDESSVFLDGPVGQGIGLTCKSQGWLPEPKVVWLNSKGQTRKEEVTTQSTKTSSGVFDVVSSMILEPGSDKEVSCRVVNNLLNATCESRVLISGEESQYICSHLFLAGEVPITISIEPAVVRVGERVTLSCQLTDSIPSNTRVLWYKMEKGRDSPLCSSSSLGGVVEQCQDEEQGRIVGLWQRRTLLLVIWQVQITDKGTYVCAVNGSVVRQEATTHLDVTGKQGDFHSEMQPAVTMLSSSKQWYPKPEVIWMNYGGDTINVEAKTNVTWSERDHFTVQSIITVPCDNVDVVCVVKLNKSKISLSGRSHFYTCICFVEGIRAFHYC